MIVNFAWVVFRSEDVASAVKYLGSMIGVGAKGVWDSGVVNYLQSTYFVLIIAIIGATPLFSKIVEILKKKKLDWIESIWVFGIFVISVLQVISSTYNPFIYFNF